MIGAAQGARMADEYVFYSLDPEVLDQLSLPPVPFPVRQELVGEVFGDERVAVDRVLDELNLYLAQHPEQEDIYREAIGVLAYVVGVTLATEGKEDAAAHCFALGLAHNPDNLSLRTNYALALHNTGREEEALQQYQRIMDDPEVDVSPLVWILAARLHAAGGDDREAYRRLRECAPQVPEGDEFWTFYAEVAERVGEDPNPPGPPPLPGSLSPPLLDEHRPEWYYAQGDQQGGPITEAALTEALATGSIAPDALVWRQGMAEWLPADSLGLGSSGDEPPASQAPGSCPTCGARYFPDARFCQDCGTPRTQ